MNRPALLILAIIVTSGCFVGLSPVDIQTLLARTLTLERQNGRLEAENGELRRRANAPIGPRPATLVITFPPDRDGGPPNDR